MSSPSLYMVPKWLEISVFLCFW